MTRRPSVYVIASPNGAGKTTFATKMRPRIRPNLRFINADEIAEGLSPRKGGSKDVAAGRIMLKNVRSEIRARSDFAFESTLGGTTYATLLAQMREKGYRIHIFYLWLRTPGLAVKRVADRVRRGGHNIPPEVIKRRYTRGLKNLWKHYAPLAESLVIFNNSRNIPKLVAVAKRGELDIIDGSVYDKILRWRPE